MHGLETIRQLNNNLPANAANTTVPTEAQELKDIGYLVHSLRCGFTPSNTDKERIADYLVAAYGIQE